MIGEMTALSQRQSYEELFEQGPKTPLCLLKAGDRFLYSPAINPGYALPVFGPVRSWVVDQRQIGGNSIDATDEDNGEIWRLGKNARVVRLPEVQP